MYCAASDIDMQSFGAIPQGTTDEVRIAIRKECMTLAGFASFVMTYLRKAKQDQNSTAHAERAVGTVRGYYKHMNGRAPGNGRGIDFTRTLRGVTRALRNLYHSTPM